MPGIAMAVALPTEACGPRMSRRVTTFLFAARCGVLMLTHLKTILFEAQDTRTTLRLCSNQLLTPRFSRFERGAVMYEVPSETVAGTRPWNESR